MWRIAILLNPVCEAAVNGAAIICTIHLSDKVIKFPAYFPDKRTIPGQADRGSALFKCKIVILNI